MSNHLPNLENLAEEEEWFTFLEVDFGACQLPCNHLFDIGVFEELSLVLAVLDGVINRSTNFPPVVAATTTDAYRLQGTNGRGRK